LLMYLLAFDDTQKGESFDFVDCLISRRSSGDGAVFARSSESLRSLRSDLSLGSNGTGRSLSSSISLGSGCSVGRSSIESSLSSGSGRSVNSLLSDGAGRSVHLHDSSGRSSGSGYSGSSSGSHHSNGSVHTSGTRLSVVSRGSGLALGSSGSLVSAHSLGSRGTRRADDARFSGYGRDKNGSVSSRLTISSKSSIISIGPRISRGTRGTSRSLLASTTSSRCIRVNHGRRVRCSGRRRTVLSLGTMESRDIDVVHLSPDIARANLAELGLHDEMRLEGSDIGVKHGKSDHRCDDSYGRDNYSEESNSTKMTMLCCIRGTIHC
ncbi:hypothetical protein PFISCL1PPCAC_6116, partial [Pristionchus fissidentatus]